MEELFGRDDFDGRQAVGWKVALIERDKIADFGFERQLSKSFVVGIGQGGFPKAGRGECLGSCAEGVQVTVHDGQSDAKGWRLPLEDLVILGEDGIAHKQ